MLFMQRCCYVKNNKAIIVAWLTHEGDSSLVHFTKDNGMHSFLALNTVFAHFNSRIKTIFVVQSSHHVILTTTWHALSLIYYSLSRYLPCRLFVLCPAISHYLYNTNLWFFIKSWFNIRHFNSTFFSFSLMIPIVQLWLWANKKHRSDIVH